MHATHHLPRWGKESIYYNFNLIYSRLCESQFLNLKDEKLRDGSGSPQPPVSKQGEARAVALRYTGGRLQAYSPNKCYIINLR